MTDTSLNLTLTVQDIDSARPVSVTDVLVEQGKPAFTIGSHEKSSLRIADPEVASTHAVITLKDGEFWIAPRASDYRVFIDNVPATRPTRLSDGGVVQLGGYTLRVSAQPLPELGASASEESSALSRDYLPRRVASLDATAPETVQVFFPRRPAPQRSSRGVLIAGLLVIALVVFGGYTLYTRVISQGMEDNAVANPFAFEDGNATLLMFDAAWCGAGCINQKLILHEVAGRFRGDVYINYADVESPGNEFLLMQYQVSTVPFVVILDDRGEPVTTFAGAVDSASLYQAVSAALRRSNSAVTAGRAS